MLLQLEPGIVCVAKDSINVLTGLKTAKVSLVNRGANRKRRFPITKSEPGMNHEMLEAVLGVEADNEAKISTIFKGISDKGADAVTAALRVLSAFADELPKDVLKGLGELSGLDAPVAKADPTDDEKKEAAKKAAALKAKEEEDDKDEKKFPFMKSLEGMDKELQARLGPVLKAHHEASLVEIKKARDDVESAKAETVEIAKTLGVERDERETTEWIRKAETELSHFPGKSSTELGTMLKGLHDHNPEMAQAQFESMKSASEAISKSDLLRSAGVGGTNVAGSAADKIEKLVDQVIAKSDKPISKAAANVMVTDQYPELYTEYLNENPSQTGHRQ